MKSKTVNHDYKEATKVTSGSAVVARCGDQCNLHLQIPSFSRKLSSQPMNRVPKNVLVLFLDAVSRQGFYRNFPQTMQVLERLQVQGKTEVTQFFRYMAIGHSTRNNARAMFTGNNSVTKRATVWETISPYYLTTIVDNSCVEWAKKYLGRNSIPDLSLNAPWCMVEYNGNRSDTYELLTGPWSIQRRCLCGRPVHEYSFE